MDLPAQLEYVKHSLKQGDPAAALKRCHVLLQQYPAHFEILHLLGLGYLQQQRLADAEHYLLRAARDAPKSPHVLNDLGITRLNQGRYTEAVELFSRALDIDTGHCDALNNIAVAFRALLRPEEARSYVERLIRLQPFASQGYVRAADNSLALNEVEQAIRLGRKAVRLAPASSAARLSLAESLEAGGRFKQAKFEYLSVLGRNPNEVAALAKLLALKGTSVPDPYQLQAQRLLERGEVKDSDRAQLHLALAHYFDQREEYDQAFEHLRSGNVIKSKNRPFDHGQFSQAIDRLIATFSAEFLRAAPSREERSKRPVFIVGMPRSGTTLVEQILASHSQIEAGGELPTIINIAAQVGETRGRYPEGIRELDPSALAGLAGRYLDRLNGISQEAARVTDKMPFNFMHLGLISVLLPGARIIHCRRDARDTCLSCYFTTFNEHLQFARGLEGIGRYYLEYCRLIEHWNSVLPRPMLEIDYERLVTEKEGAIRDLLAFCEVEWEPGCEEFYRTARGVRTPSRWQVRQPIYKQSVGRWRHYARDLQPLLEILAPALQRDAG